MASGMPIGGPMGVTVIMATETPSIMMSNAPATTMPANMATTLPAASMMGNVGMHHGLHTMQRMQTTMQASVHMGELMIHPIPMGTHFNPYAAPPAPQPVWLKMDTVPRRREGEETVGNAVGDLHLHSGQTRPLSTDLIPGHHVGSGSSIANAVPSDHTEESEVISAPVFAFFRDADGIDRVLMILGTIGAIFNGGSLPFFTVFLGQIVNLLDSTSGGTTSGEELQEQVNEVAILFGVFAVLAFVSAGMEVSCWSVAASRRVRRLRYKYLSSILRQDMAFFEGINTSALSSSMSERAYTMSLAMGDRVGSVIAYVSRFLSCTVISLVLGWHLALAVVASVPIVVGAIAFQQYMQKHATAKAEAGYQEAAGVAEETTHNMRTVKQLGQEQQQAAEYRRCLTKAEAAAQRAGLMSGIGFGSVTGSSLAFFGLAVWFGGWLIANEVTNDGTGEGYRTGSVIAVILSMLLGAMGLGQMQNPLMSVSRGRVAAASVFQVIDTEPTIDALGPSGLCPFSCQGRLAFKEVWFAYPSRPEAWVLSGFGLEVEGGHTVALVGASGCGKSTVLQLVQRLYDVEKGSVTLDGVDVRELNVRWLRQQLGVVSQEPVLFARSIRDNVKLGKADGEASEAEVEEACKVANAAGFISELPQGYETLCGDRGARLSGGQKQRIAIARAMVRKPRVLLLDEATSALDSQSEEQVQAALQHVSCGRTTLLVAHRLSTVASAHRIAVLDQGRVVEAGTHAVLLQAEGAYARMVRAQRAGGRISDSADSAAATGPMVAATGQLSAATLVQLPLAPSASNLDLETVKAEAAGSGEEGSHRGIALRLLMLSRPEFFWVGVAVLCAGVMGAQYPIFAVLFSRAIAEMQGAQGRGELSGRVSTYAIALSVQGLVGFVASLGQTSLFAFIGERLTRRLRSASFDKMVQLRLQFWEKPSHAPGVLCARLALDASVVRGACAERLGSMMQNATTLVGGMVVGFVAGWKLALVVLACIPLMTLAAFIEKKAMQGALDSGGDEEVEATMSEMLGSRAVVATLTLEARLLEHMDVDLRKAAARQQRQALSAGLTYGWSQGVQFAIWGLAFWYGGKLVVDGEWRADPESVAGACPALLVQRIYSSMEECARGLDLARGVSKMLEVVFGIILGCFGMGEAMSYAPDAAKASLAAAAIFRLLDSHDDDEPFQDRGQQQQLGEVRGRLAFKEVWFAYPSRPEAWVLSGFGLEVEGGHTVALVGASGCGKSTVLQLVQRLYDVEKGSVTLDGVDVRELNVRWLRQQLGVVSQEPVLFARSIRDNVKLGKADGEASEAEVEEACKVANAAGFISELPQGYETLCGDRGARLSGGQKQRIAIARAMVRKPRVLLLDEATSALDSQSEEQVQAALQHVSCGRTTLLVAHRLSTVASAHRIAVLDQGRVVEAGTHPELRLKRGAYSAMLSSSIH